MNQFLTGVVAVVAVVSAVNLLLMFAVVRRLRTLEAGRPPSALPMPGTGQRVGRFELETTDGATLSDEDFQTGTALAVFLTAECAPCLELATALETAPLLPSSVAVFIVSDTGPAAALAARLARRGRTALVPLNGAATRAFGVTAFPTVVMTRDGVVAYAGSRLPQTVAAHVGT